MKARCEGGELSPRGDMLQVAKTIGLNLRDFLLSFAGDKAKITECFKNTGSVGQNRSSHSRYR